MKLTCSEPMSITGTFINEEEIDCLRSYATANSYIWKPLQESSSKGPIVINKITYKGKDITDSMRDIFRWVEGHQDYLDSQKPIPRPADPIKKVYFNYKKGTTTVIWKDGIVTTVRCQGDEPFDEEKGLAMCFVKKQFDNRGCYNEIFKKWIVDAELQGKIFHEDIED